MSVVRWALDAPGRRLLAPAIVVEWALAAAWLVHTGVVSL